MGDLPSHQNAGGEIQNAFAVATCQLRFDLVMCNISHQRTKNWNPKIEVKHQKTNIQKAEQIFCLPNVIHSNFLDKILW